MNEKNNLLFLSDLDPRRHFNLENDPSAGMITSFDEPESQPSRWLASLEANDDERDALIVANDDYAEESEEGEVPKSQCKDLHVSEAIIEIPLNKDDLDDSILQVIQEILQDTQEPSSLEDSPSEVSLKRRKRYIVPVAKSIEWNKSRSSRHEDSSNPWSRDEHESSAMGQGGNYQRKSGPVATDALFSSFPHLAPPEWRESHPSRGSTVKPQGEQ